MLNKSEFKDRLYKQFYAAQNTRYNRYDNDKMLEQFRTVLFPHVVEAEHKYDNIRN